MTNFLKKLTSIFKVIIFVLAIIAAVINWQEIKNLYLNIFNKLPEIKDALEVSRQEISQSINKQINTPPPLTAKKDYEQAYLSINGIVKYTNIEREKIGLSPLGSNILLNTSADIKVKDMLNKQYFEHTSPEGKDIDDLADQVGYEYIVIGENLAMGNFLNDEKLVEGWMASPGHRENILNPRYTEIGVAVVKGNYQGKVTWLAVQHFGKPLSDCPEPDTTLATQIDANQALLDQMQTELLNLKNELEAIKPKRNPEYNQLVEEYNSLVEQYNNLINQTKALVEEYNQQIITFNSCAG